MNTKSVNYNPSISFQKLTLISFVLCLFIFAGCKKDSGTVPPPAATISISSFSPSTGGPGTEVVISGTGFSTTPGANTVLFNGVATSVTAARSNSLTVTVPATANSGKISVQNGTLTATSANDFIVAANLSISGFSPATGAPGITVVITGTGFSTNPRNNIVKFNGEAAIVSAATSTSLTVAVPPSATTGKILIQYGTIKAISANDFLISTAGLRRFLKTMVTYYNNTSTNDSTDFVYDTANRLSSLRTAHIRNLNPATDYTTYTWDASGKLKEMVLADGTRNIFFGPAVKPDSIYGSRIHKYYYTALTIVDSVFESSESPVIYSHRCLYTLNGNNNIASLTVKAPSYDDETWSYTYDNKKSFSKLAGVIIPDVLSEQRLNLFYVSPNNITSSTTDSDSDISGNYKITYTYDEDGYPITRKITYSNAFVFNTIFRYTFK